MSGNRYSIVFTRRARKDIDKLDRKTIARIVPVIEALSDDPRPPGCVKVKSEVIFGEFGLAIGASAARSTTQHQR